MKKNFFARRAAAAVLAVCMAFTLSAPALAESADALQTPGAAALSENSGILVNGEPVETLIAGGTMKYDGKTLEAVGRFAGDLKIELPEALGVDVSLPDGCSNSLTVTGARNVTVQSSENCTLGDQGTGSNVEINCTGDVRIVSHGARQRQCARTADHRRKLCKCGTFCLQRQCGSFGGYQLHR